MINLNLVLYKINEIERQSSQTDALHNLDARAKLITTLLFLVFMLSLPITAIENTVLFASFPIALCSMAKISYSTIAVRSLIVLPFVALVGIFNPILDSHTQYMIGRVAISSGWVSFVTIILRGLLATQAILILIATTGFHRICTAMTRLGVPTIFATLLLLIYHYIFILLEEAMSMHRARVSRSFGKKSYSLKEWSTFVGLLFLRALSHSQAVYNAMLSRGFNGKIAVTHATTWTMRDTAFTVFISLALILLRFINLF